MNHHSGRSGKSDSGARQLPCPQETCSRFNSGGGVGSPEPVLVPQPVQQSGIGGREIKSRQFLATDPTQRRTAQGPGLMPPPRTSKEPKVYGLLRVLVGKGLDEVVKGHLDAEFFLQFAVQTFLEGLIRPAFAPGKFPESTQMPIVGTLSDEQSALAKHQTGTDLDDIHR